MEQTEKLLVVGVIMFMGLINAVIYWSIPECRGCKMTNPNTGDIINGECDKLINRFYKFEDYLNISVTTTTQPATRVTMEPCNCPTSTTHPPCVIPDCVCTCPVCHECPEPDCEEYVVSDALEAIEDARPPVDNVAWQNGFYWMKCFAREQLGGTCPKFKEGPSSGAFKYLSGIPQKEDDKVFCFRDLGGYILLNRSIDAWNQSMWGWNDEACHNSVLRVNRL